MEVGVTVHAENPLTGERFLTTSALMTFVAIDKDGGVTMDDIADATREVSRLLDDTGVMGEQAYTLEVSSPGVDRPLTLPRHWRRNTRRLVKVTFDEGAVLDVEGTEQRVAYADVKRAKVQIEFKKENP